MELKKTSHQPSILWLEDNLGMVNLFKDEFETHYRVIQVGSLEELKKLPRNELCDHDIVLLDLDLPDGNTSDETIQFLRSSGLSSPILILTNDESLKSRLDMLANGVEDYLWKAMHPEEMLLRIRNAISRFRHNKNETKAELYGVKVDTITLSVELNEKKIELSKIEFQFLMLLIRKYPLPATVDELRINVWKISNLEMGTINTFIWKMNKKLEDWSCRLSKNGEQVILQLK